PRVIRRTAVGPSRQANRPWQCLYFLPEPQGHSSLRPTLPQLDGSFGLRSAAGFGVMPARASVCAPASASASSSSPDDGSTCEACIGGNSGTLLSGCCCTISTRISFDVTALRRLWLLASERLT